MSELVLAQMVELVVIVVSIQVCLLVFWLRGKINELRALVFPVFLFFVFGTADALVTIANNVNAVREGNPYARVFIEFGGWKGYVFLSFLWILLWALIALVLLELREKASEGRAKALFLFFCFVEFYALAVGHLSGFLSWHGVFLFNGSQEEKFALFVLAGGVLAVIHSAISLKLRQSFV